MTLVQPGFQATLSLLWRFALVMLAGLALWQVLHLEPEELRPLSQLPLARKPEPMDVRPEATPRPTEDYAAIQAAPLFYPSRQPWVPPTPPVEETPPPAPSPLNDYALVGVVLSGDSRSAILRLAREGRTIVLSEGQELEGWTLREITRERARFVAGDSEYEMTFPKPSESQR